MQKFRQFSEDITCEYCRRYANSLYSLNHIFDYYDLYKIDAWLRMSTFGLNAMCTSIFHFFDTEIKVPRNNYIFYGNRGSNNKVWFTTVPLVPRLVPLYLDFRSPIFNDHLRICVPSERFIVIKVRYTRWPLVCCSQV